MTPKERFGWLMFTLSGVLFLIVAVRSRDWITGAGVVAWLLGCGVFLSGTNGDGA